MTHSMNRAARTKKTSLLASLLMTFTLICPVSGPMALAQSSKGILAGTVTDPDGAVVAGAVVKITNNATGTVRETTTTDDGNYRIDAIDPGIYNAEVTTSGFKTVTRSDITIAAGQATTSDFALAVGAPGESVNVTADNTAILQKQDGARSNTLEQRQIVDLPVAGLNPVIWSSRYPAFQLRDNPAGLCKAQNSRLTDCDRAPTVNSSMAPRTMTFQSRVRLINRLCGTAIRRYQYSQGITLQSMDAVAAP